MENTKEAHKANTDIIMCKVFYCKKKRDYICCHSCDKREKCSTQCLNGPERCNLVDEEETKRRNFCL